MAANRTNKEDSAYCAHPAEGCGCAGHRHDHNHDHDAHECRCEHHHSEQKAQTVSAHVGGGVALCKLSNHEDASVVSCVLELEGATLQSTCLAAALAGIATDVEKLGGIVGHIKCTAVGNEGTLRVSVTQAAVAPTIVVDNLEVLNEESEITIAIICFAISHQEILESLLVRLERLF